MCVIHSLIHWLKLLSIVYTEIIHGGAANSRYIMNHISHVLRYQTPTIRSDSRSCHSTLTGPRRGSLIWKWKQKIIAYM